MKIKTLIKILQKQDSEKEVKIHEQGNVYDLNIKGINYQKKCDIVVITGGI